jgi:hypothetical protein
MAQDSQLQDALLDEIEGVNAQPSSNQAAPEWDEDSIRAFQAGQLDMPQASNLPPAANSPQTLNQEEKAAISPAPQESESRISDEDSVLDDLQSIEQNLASNARKVNTAQQMQRLVDNKPLIDAIMTAQDAARVAEEAAQTNLASTQLIVDRFEQQEEEGRRKDQLTQRFMREMDFRIQNQASKSAWSARLGVINLVLLLSLMGAGGAGVWMASESPLLKVQQSASLDQQATSELQTQTLSAVLEINEHLRMLEKNLNGLQAQWTQPQQHASPRLAQVEVPVSTVAPLVAQDLAALEQDLRFLKTQILAIKQTLMANTSDREILRVRESLELLKSELVGMKIQEQKVASQLKQPEPSPYKYVVPPNLNPY